MPSLACRTYCSGRVYLRNLGWLCFIVSVRCSFCRAMLCIARPIPSCGGWVSICHVRVLRQNGYRYAHSCYANRNPYSSFRMVPFSMTLNDTEKQQYFNDTERRAASATACLDTWDHRVTLLTVHTCHCEAWFKWVVCCWAVSWINGGRTVAWNLYW